MVIPAQGGFAVDVPVSPAGSRMRASATAPARKAGRLLPGELMGTGRRASRSLGPVVGVVTCDLRAGETLESKHGIPGCQELAAHAVEIDGPRPERRGPQGPRTGDHRQRRDQMGLEGGPDPAHRADRRRLAGHGNPEAAKHGRMVEIARLRGIDGRLAEGIAVPGAEEIRLTPPGEGEMLPRSIRIRNGQDLASPHVLEGERECHRALVVLLVEPARVQLGAVPGEAEVSASELELEGAGAARFGKLGEVARQGQHAGHPVLLYPGGAVRVGREHDSLWALPGQGAIRFLVLARLDRARTTTRADRPAAASAFSWAP